MTDQKKNQEQATQGQPEVPEPSDAGTNGYPGEHERHKDTTEKIWDSTKHAWNTAAFKASQYKRLVQKKIDLSALHKKIGAAHSELGKLIDDLREAGKKSIMTQPEVKEMFQNIDSFKAAAAALEEEIENIKDEHLRQAPEDTTPTE